MQARGAAGARQNTQEKNTELAMQMRKVRFATLILGGILAASGCSYFHASQTPDDNAITSTIQAKLFQDPILKKENIQVLSQKGVVVLSGTVSSDAEKPQAEQIANGVSGVKQVIDQLSVNSSPTAGAAEGSPTSARTERPRPARERVSQTREAQNSPPSGSASPAAAQPPSQQPTSAEQTPPPPPQPVSITIPAGTVLTVRTIDAVDSSKNHAGDVVRASLAAPVAQDGQVVIPQDANAQLRVVQVVSAGHFKGQSKVQLQLVSVSVGGVKYPVEASSYSQQGASRGKRSAETIGGGAALGALIGAIAGHGKGAAIGAAVGAGAGTAVQGVTHGQQVVIPSETEIRFTLRRPLTVTSNP